MIFFVFVFFCLSFLSYVLCLDAFLCLCLFILRGSVLIYSSRHCAIVLWKCTFMYCLSFLLKCCAFKVFLLFFFSLVHIFYMYAVVLYFYIPSLCCCAIIVNLVFLSCIYDNMLCLYTFFVIFVRLYHNVDFCIPFSDIFT